VGKESGMSFDAWIKEVEERVKAATPGPWKIDDFMPDTDFAEKIVWSPNKEAWDEDDDSFNTIATFPVTGAYGYGCDPNQRIDAEFITHARTDIPKLLEAVKLLQEVVRHSIPFCKCPDGRALKPIEAHERYCDFWICHEAFVQLDKTAEGK
jgi:hypothetical protein